MNQVALVGKVIGAPYYQTTEKSAADFTKFHLLTGDLNQQANKLEEIVKHDCIAWGPIALLLHTHLYRGSRLAIKGRLHYHHFTTEQDCQICKPEIIVEGFTFLDGG